MTKFVSATVFGGNKAIEDIQYTLSYNHKVPRTCLSAKIAKPSLIASQGMCYLNQN